MPALERHQICLLMFLSAAVARAGGDGDALDDLREVARAKFEAVHRTPEERGRALLEATREGYWAVFQEYMAGKTPLDALMKWSSGPVLEARRAAAGKDADPTPLLEEHWRQALTCEEISLATFNHSQMGIADFMEVRGIRLRAEAAWVQARAELGKTPGVAATAFSIRLNMLEPPEASRELEDQHQRAKKQFDALQTVPAERAASEVEAARQVYLAMR